MIKSKRKYTLATLISALIVFSAQNANALVPNKIVAAPRAFSSFCANNPGQCSVRGSNTIVAMTAARWQQLRTTNGAVNRSIRETTDRANKGRDDVWSIVAGGGRGDCEDFALTKRQKLLGLGWPSSAPRISGVRTRAGEGHAVLIVRTSEGNYVLDNRSGSIRRASSTGYRFYTMQSPSNPRTWITIPTRGPEASTKLASAKAATNYRSRGSRWGRSSSLAVGAKSASGRNRAFLKLGR